MFSQARPIRIHPAYILLWFMLTTLPVMAQDHFFVRYGENIQDAIQCRSTDTLTFAAEANDVVVIHVVELSDFGGVCGSACFCFDQLIELRDMHDHVLADNSSPTSQNTRSRYRTQVGPARLSESGNYTISIKDKQSNGRGEYRVFLQCVNKPQGAELLLPGEGLLSTLNLGAVATFQFGAGKGTHVTIDMTAGEVSDVVPRLELFDSTGDAIAWPNSGNIDILLDRGGLFTLLAFSEVDQSGTYQLNLEVQPCLSDADCNDDDFCTADHCADGVCEFSPLNCNIDDPCMTGVCNPSDGLCVYYPITCHDGYICDPTTGACVRCLIDEDCNDGNPCTAETCNSARECVVKPSNSSTCDDGDVCNGEEVCEAGDCVSGVQMDCDDGNPCTTDTCDPTDGCVHVPECLSDRECAGDLCSSGVCVEGCCETEPMECWELAIEISTSDYPSVRQLPPTLHRADSEVLVFVAQAPETCNDLCPPDSCDGRCVQDTDFCSGDCVFRGWTDLATGDVLDDNPRVLTMDSAKTIIASFEAIECREDADCSDGKSCIGDECITCVPAPVICGGHESGVCASLVLSFLGWASLRLVSMQRRLCGRSVR